MTDRNNTPRNHWQALRRLLNCNKSQLAARLGVNRHTLRIWEKEAERGEPVSDNARRAAAELLTATLRAADNADELLKARTKS